MKLLLVICAFASAHCQPCVKTTEGDLCGTTYTLSNNRTVYAYYGIPYAAAPIGENRFQVHFVLILLKIKFLLINGKCIAKLNILGASTAIQLDRC